MKITYKGDYALKVILDLAVHYSEKVTPIHALAKRLDIPVKFLKQILSDLKRGGFVRSRRGKIGGYNLAQRPEEIKLGSVIRFIEGPLEPIACIEKEYAGCSDIYKCVFRKIWQEVSATTSGIVDNITFEDLVNRVITEAEGDNRLPTIKGVGYGNIRQQG